MSEFENKPFEDNHIEEQTVGPVHRPEPVAEEPVVEPAVEQEPVSQPYSGTGTGRKESPFADSPYVARPQPEFKQGYTVPESKPVSRKQKKSGKGWKIAIALVLAAAVLGGTVAGTAAAVNSSWEKKAAQMESDFADELEKIRAEIGQIDVTGGNSMSGSPVSTTGMTPSQVYNQNVRSVVAISNQGTTNFFGQVTETASSGTGFILTEDGYVVTNYHVVSGADTLSVLTYDGTEYPAKLIGYEENNDLAVLKIEATGLPAVTIGSSDKLIIGDMVVAIGNPLGELTSTMTVGYLSAKDRDVTTDRTTINMMQTDAAINPGNSGGPLFNMLGEVVGITTAKYSGTTGSGATIEGIGFAIPVDDVMGMVYDLIDYGYVTGAYLGVSVKDMDVQTATVYDLPLGSYVAEVTEGSCAEAAGVKVKDIIIGLGDYEVEGYSDLSRALRKYKAGDTTTIRVYRSGQELELTVTLDEKPQPVIEDPTVPAPTGDESGMPENGSFEEWYEYFKRHYGID